MRDASDFGDNFVSECASATDFGHFYRAMHFSAKRGIEIACRLSVCLSVTLVDQDHIGLGRKSWKLIARTLSPTHSLFGAKKS